MDVGIVSIDESPKTIDEKTENRLKLRKFKQELTWLINRHGMEAVANAPDHILADFVIAQIVLFGRIRDNLEYLEKV